MRRRATIAPRAFHNKTETDTDMTTATITTTRGAIKLELFTEQAPKTTDNFIKLAKDGYIF